MIIAIYATLGVFLLIASRNPNQHLGLISFAIWSGIVHGGVMAVQSVQNPVHVHHLYGDVPALLVIAAFSHFFRRRHFGYLSPNVRPDLSLNPDASPTPLSPVR